VIHRLSETLSQTAQPCVKMCHQVTAIYDIYKKQWQLLISTYRIQHNRKLIKGPRKNINEQKVTKKYVRLQ